MHNGRLSIQNEDAVEEWLLASQQLHFEYEVTKNALECLSARLKNVVQNFEKVKPHSDFTKKLEDRFCRKMVTHY